MDIGKSFKVATLSLSLAGISAMAADNNKREIMGCEDNDGNTNHMLTVYTEGESKDVAIVDVTIPFHSYNSLTYNDGGSVFGTQNLEITLAVEPGKAPEDIMGFAFKLASNSKEVVIKVMEDSAEGAEKQIYKTITCTVPGR
jgi:hypothetical protein